MKGNKYQIKYTIEAIGTESVFGSKSAFHNAFKKITGITPLAFRNNIK